MSSPRYPAIRVRTRSRNPITLVAAVRQALRQARVDRARIREFSDEVFESAGGVEPERVCREWVDVEARR
ncbi:MAG: hypothetical protein OES32_04550 [Acidobacteriota bacterium]|nr:hypothetical protein [Acidobacteriota bacterium]